MADTREQIVAELEKRATHARERCQYFNPMHPTLCEKWEAAAIVLDDTIQFIRSLPAPEPHPAGEQQGKPVVSAKTFIAQQAELAALRTQLSTAEQRVKEAEEIGNEMRLSILAALNDAACLDGYWITEQPQPLQLSRLTFTFQDKALDRVNRWAAHRAKYEVRK